MLKALLELAVIQNLGTYLTPTIAGFVAIIAYRQWRTANDKLRLDLYNRRFELYLAALNWSDVILRWQATEKQKEVWEKFKRAATESQFLFPPESKIGSQFQAFKNNSQNITLMVVLIDAEDSEGKKGETNWAQFRLDAVNVCINRQFVLDAAIWPYLQFYSSTSPVNWVKGIRARQQFQKMLDERAKKAGSWIDTMMEGNSERGGRWLE